MNAELPKRIIAVNCNAHGNLIQVLVEYENGRRAYVPPHEVNQLELAEFMEIRRQHSVEVIPLCDCTGEELEQGRTCGQEHCPNRE